MAVVLGRPGPQLCPKRESKIAEATFNAATPFGTFLETARNQTAKKAAGVKTDMSAWKMHHLSNREFDIFK